MLYISTIHASALSATSPALTSLHHRLPRPPPPPPPPPPKPFVSSISSSNPNPSLLIHSSLPPHKPRTLLQKPPPRSPSTSSSAAAAAAAADALETAAEESKELQGGEKQLRVVAKTMEKPRLVLKFVWMEKNIGLALDQVIPGHGSVPLSPYYFWPRKDAWEELKSKLEEKQWISQKRMIILLNQATDIINLWQQSGGNL
ncbi:30S ribosomal protein 3-1, chloroplastic-like isoform X2 [Ananas comosus]|uniref:30S ribosomal protein 3, chloroplastic n=1 Tax=Ananas comosus TaxID=4615 RepID=A0A6P5GHX4_ANACO|nr:30S ribosomal protein 3-1, chloroplastic-like isoform X2 [Ananas comosus]